MYPVCSFLVITHVQPGPRGTKWDPMAVVKFEQTPELPPSADANYLPRVPQDLMFSPVFDRRTSICRGVTSNVDVLSRPQ
jgi:hypothetical protein